MVRHHSAALRAAFVIAVLGLPAGLAAESSSAAYYRNDLAVAIGLERLGPFKRVAVGSDKIVFTVSWEGIEPRRPDARTDYAPTFAYYKTTGKPLRLSAVAKAMQAGPFDSGRALLLEQDREALYGFIGTDGAWAIKPRFAEATGFEGGFACAREPGGRWGVIGSDGRWSIEPAFVEAQRIQNQGVIAGRRDGEASSRYYDARSGAPIAVTDPRVSSPSMEGADSLKYDGYSLKDGRSATVSGSEFSNYVNIITPAGATASAGVFNGVQTIRGAIAVVALGYYGDWWGDGPTTTSFSRGQGAFGLLDLATGKFLIPPYCSQILPVDGGLWYARPHGERAFLFDAATGAKVRSMPDFPVLWIAGPVTCGLDSTVDDSSNGEMASGEINIGAAINSDKVRMRSKPSLSGAIVTEFSKGTRLRVHGFKAAVETISDWTGIWTQVETEDGKKGWVFGYFLDIYRYCQ